MSIYVGIFRSASYIFPAVSFEFRHVFNNITRAPLARHSTIACAGLTSAECAVSKTGDIKFFGRDERFSISEKNTSSQGKRGGFYTKRYPKDRLSKSRYFLVERALF